MKLLPKELTTSKGAADSFKRSASENMSFLTSVISIVCIQLLPNAQVDAYLYCVFRCTAIQG